MDSFELNKIIAAVLLVALIIIGIGKLSDAIFYVEKPKTPGGRRGGTTSNSQQRN